VVKARYYETDKMKIVHHSNYFRYFEVARCDFFAKKIISYSLLEEKYKILSPLLQASAKFFKPLRFEDVFSIVSFINDFSLIKLSFEYLVFFGSIEGDNLLNKIISYFDSGLKGMQDLVCWGQTVHTFVDANKFFPIKPKVFIEERTANLDDIIKGLVIRAAVAQLDQSM
ncbi:MAG: acyl-CoA thioesterase, partial [bacterium]